MKKHKPRKPFADRSDLEKISAQWTKLSGLHAQDEWSAAVVRAATAAEIAANFAVRKEFASRSEFKSEFIDNLLVWANGLGGKIDRILIPVSKGERHHETIKSLKQASSEIAKKRNRIAHQGEFCSRKTARQIIGQAKGFIETLVRIYEPEYALKDIEL